ncbi:MAG: nitronate monooxygenase [Candidatus Gastranaerophilales bacterium]|nr:nitronate monooxygenase [Candidatus Gastranaerophilales bacterium]
MIFPKLQISENLEVLVPIIQGGMAIRVSRAPLAAAVANMGGIGVIAASGLREKELREQIRLARKLQLNKKGAIAVNIMFAASEFNMLVNVSIEEGIDLIITGAGFSRDIFAMGKEGNVPIFPIVSSAKLAKISKKLGASGIIVESGEAGGHLGTDLSINELIPDIKDALNSVPDQKDYEIPLIAAGGITSGMDIINILRKGANGVQMATRFVLSKECDVSDVFKKVYLNIANLDMTLINSPVGMKARSIITPLVERIMNGTQEKPDKCIKCLKNCSQSFCIIKALDLARRGDFENGLFFVGENIAKYKEILSVKEIFEKFQTEAAKYVEECGKFLKV